MPQSALDIFRHCEGQLRSGQYGDALPGYLRIVRAVPAYWRARFRIADVLLNLHESPKALAIYKALAWQALQNGQPLAGLLAIKMAASIDPSEHETIEAVAQLYSHTSTRINPLLEAAPRRVLQTDDVCPELDGTLSTADLVSTAAREAEDTSTMGAFPKMLPPIPLFSFLDEETFVAVLANLQLRRFVQGSTLLVEGEPGESFFLLAEGNVEVSRQSNGRSSTLARLPSGSVFGEMALVSQAPRAATVTALEDCDALELKRSVLQSSRLKSVGEALKRFTNERFLTNLTATSPVFKPFPRTIRAEIMKKFRDHPVAAGEALIREGEAGKGLFLVMQGEVDVSTRDGSGDRVVLALLKQGDVFGEIALLEDAPAGATVTATRAGELLFLPKNEFNSAMARHPELKHELRKLTVERVAKNRQLLETEAFHMVEDDDLIMV